MSSTLALSPVERHSPNPSTEHLSESGSETSDMEQRTYIDAYGRPRRRLRGGTNQCPSCNEFFRSVTGFDAHRTGEMTMRRCLTTNEMRAEGMSITAGCWVTKASTWHSGGDDE